MAVDFIGSTYEDAFILADVECSEEDHKDTIDFFFKKKDFLAMIPLAKKEKLSSYFSA